MLGHFDADAEMAGPIPLDLEEPFTPGLADTQKRMNLTLGNTTDSNLLSSVERRSKFED